jgi:uncharacterized integral membrane protein
MARKIILGILVLLIVIFVAQNTQMVEVRFLVWSISMSRALILISTFLLGVILTLLLRTSKKRKK